MAGQPRHPVALVESVRAHRYVCAMAWLAERYQTHQRISARQYSRTSVSKLVYLTAASTKAGRNLRASRAIRPLRLPTVPGELPHRQPADWLLCCTKYPENVSAPHPPDRTVGIPAIVLCVSRYSGCSGSIASQGISACRRGAAPRHRSRPLPSGSGW